MKICVIGTMSGQSDEGFKNIARHVCRVMARMHDVATIDSTPGDIPGYLRQVRRFRPDILHCITAPTLSSFIALRAGRAVVGGRVHTIASCLHANGFESLAGTARRGAAARMLPDLLLTQSREMDMAFAELGAKTRLFPNGVDTARFKPVEPGRKAELRERFGLDPDQFVVLHVGHVNATRGLDLFRSLRKNLPDLGVVIAGSSHFPIDDGLKRALERDGCTVWHRFFPQVEELYQMADSYVFPPAKTILMPLSILEALSCNLPVVCYPFPGIQAFLSENGGLRFASRDDEFSSAVKDIMEGNQVTRTRDMVLSLSWEHLSTELEKLYRMVCEERS